MWRGKDQNDCTKTNASKYDRYVLSANTEWGRFIIIGFFLKLDMPSQSLLRWFCIFIVSGATPCDKFVKSAVLRIALFVGGKVEEVG